MLFFNISASSRVGLVRENNEDMLLVGREFVRNAEVEIQEQIAAEDRYLLALADGMGGHNCGEVASSDTLHNLQFFFSDIPSGLDVEHFNESIYEWMNSINHIIDAKGRSDRRYRNMGTTLVALAYYEHHFYWMNCGDSRLYLLHEGSLRQLTVDHSLSNMLGQKTHSNIITNCIGGGCATSFIDIMQCTRDIERGDTLMLCSDGLTDMVADADIERLLNEGAGAPALCSAAEAAGGADNVSVIVLRIK